MQTRRSSTFKETSKKHSDKNKCLFQIALENGYVLQRHKYTTEDGYINTVFRLEKDSTLINKPRETEITDPDGKKYDLHPLFKKKTAPFLGQDTN